MLTDGTTDDCEMKRVKKGVESFCPSGMYGSYSKCFTVHNEYVTNMEASRYQYENETLHT